MAMGQKLLPRCSHWPANAQDGSFTAMSCGAMRNEQQLRWHRIEPRRWLWQPSAFVSESATQVGSSTSARSEEHTSELQSLMRISYAVFCLKKKHIITYKDM